ncbi:MAG: PTS sugar transporter subunit IIA [bacterium]|nr:PTS sugar transporter subunit IIA [bacterium]MBU1916924.1 PTS sugar transporter subunit IIA [bacterium]
MKLSDLLTEDALIPQLQSEDKNSVLEEFANHATSISPDLNKDLILKILVNREQLGSTAVGNGVAIPHGKVPGLEKIIALFGRSESGIDFHSHDEKTTQLFFVLLAPETAIGNHLQALARLSRLLKDSRIREKLIQCPKEELYNFLISEDNKI